jgi:hypothetical protein
VQWDNNGNFSQFGGYGWTNTARGWVQNASGNSAVTVQLAAPADPDPELVKHTIDQLLALRRKLQA